MMRAFAARLLRGFRISIAARDGACRRTRHDLMRTCRSRRARPLRARFASYAEEDGSPLRPYRLAFGSTPAAAARVDGAAMRTQQKPNRGDRHDAAHA